MSRPVEGRDEGPEPDLGPPGRTRRDSSIPKEVDPEPGGSDPVLERRARVLQWTNAGQRIGYAVFCLFLVIVVVGLLLGFNPVLAVLGIASLVVGSLVLAPSIVLAYGAKAAEKDERGGAM